MYEDFSRPACSWRHMQTLTIPVTPGVSCWHTSPPDIEQPARQQFAYMYWSNVVHQALWQYVQCTTFMHCVSCNDSSLNRQFCLTFPCIQSVLRCLQQDAGVTNGRDSVQQDNTANWVLSGKFIHTNLVLHLPVQLLNATHYTHTHTHTHTHSWWTNPAMAN